MPFDMSTLNIKNFSYFAFNCKDAPLSKQQRKVITAIHILLGLIFPGLGHGIMGIVYAVHLKDFKKGLTQIANNPIVNPVLKPKSFDKIQVLQIDDRTSPPIYTCQSTVNGITYLEIFKEEKLKKIIQDKSIFIEDFKNLLNDDRLDINSASRVYRFPILAGLDFSKIDYLSITGWTDSIPRTYSIKVFYKNGNEAKTILSEPDFKMIKEDNLANIENPGRFFNVSRGNTLQEEVYKIKELTGLDLALVDKISVTFTKESYPIIHCSKIYYSNGKVENWELEDEGMKKIQEFGRVPVEWYKESLEA